MTPHDHLDVLFEKAAGRVLSFSVNYRAEIGAAWHEVIRYDTHHGHLHVHKFWRKKHRQIEAIERPGPQPHDYGKALAAAETDIEDHWQGYRDHLVRSLRR